MLHPSRFTPRKWPGTHCIGGWVDTKASLEGWGKSRPPPGFDPRTVHPLASRYIDYSQKGLTLTKPFFLNAHRVMIRFSCRKNTASIFRVTNVSSGRWSDIEDEMCQLFSLLRHWKIVRGSNIYSGPMGIQIRKDARSSFSAYWPWKIRLPLHAKHTHIVICNGHISFPLSHQQPYEWIQSPSRRKQLVYSS